MDLPLVRRVAWHVDRIGEYLDPRLFAVVGGLIAGVIGVAAVGATMLEKDWTLDALGDSFYWAVNTVLVRGTRIRGITGRMGLS
ncbi:MAG: hypothetical protein WKF78_11585 [Candidatus Limnocylindrales bacterium]